MSTSETAREADPPTPDFAVIFDLDGVIVDSNWAHQQTIQMLCRRYGLDVSETELKTCVFGRRNSEWILEVFGNDLKPAEVNRLSEEKEALFRGVFAPRMVLLPGLQPFLDLLSSHGIPMAIATSAPAANVDFVLSRAQLADRFAVILDETSICSGKPDPEIYLRAASRLGLPSTRCVVFEDSLAGIAAARRAGGKVVAVATTHRDEELANADLVISDFVGLTVTVLEELVNGCGIVKPMHSSLSEISRDKFQTMYAGKSRVPSPTKLIEEVKPMPTNEPEWNNGFDVVTLSEAIQTLPVVSQLLGEKRPLALKEQCDTLLEKCLELFRAEVCAIYIVKNHGEAEVAELEAHREYTRPHGGPIDFKSLHRALKYKVERNKSEDDVFDGITGFVASTGRRVRFNSWEEIKDHKSHAGKPDKLGIWNDNRPFRCMVAEPLKLHGKTIGVLKVENKRDPEKRGVTFDETDEVLLDTLAECFSMALGYAELRSQLGVELESELEIEPDQPLATGSRSAHATPRHTLRERAARFDNSNMAQVIERVPSQIEIALSQQLPSIQGGPFSQVFIAGMGGSALPAEVVMDAFAERLKVPIKVIRHYALPQSVDERSLIIVSSFSGDTEETLSVIERLPKSAQNVAVISAGGHLTTLAHTRRYPLVEIPLTHEPKGFQPRSAVGYFVTYFARLLALAGVMDDVTTELEAVPRFLRETEIRPRAEDIAVWLKPRIPLIYTDENHRMSIGRIAKIKFNENSKRAAFFNALPEANHNEMIGFSRAGLGKMGILYLHDPDSHPRIRDRFYVMKKVFMEAEINHVTFREWEIPGKTKIQKIFAALVFADWCSYTLALVDGFDPTPVALVESFKKVLASFRAEDLSASPQTKI